MSYPTTTVPACVEAIVRANCAARLAADPRGEPLSFDRARRETMERVVALIAPRLPAPTAAQLFDLGG